MQYVSDIRRLVQDGHYHPAIVLALMMPDICAAIASGNGETDGAKFQAWFEQNLAHQFPRLTARDFWKLRCGVVHQGRMGHPQMQFARVIFSLPDGRGNVFHDNIMNDALNLDARIFCETIIAAVESWLRANANDGVVQRNLERLLRVRPEGIAPYMLGMPVIS